MKKKLILIVVALLSTLLCVVFIISSIWTKKQLLLDGYFDNWEKEAESPYYSTYRAYLYYNDEKFYVDNVEGNVDEIFCMRNNEIFLVHSSLTPDNSKGEIWSISSINVNTNKQITWFSGKFADKISDYIQYNSLSQYSDIDTLCGGMMVGDTIYLTDTVHTISFNVETKEINEDATLPIRRFEWAIVADSYVEIIEKQSGTIRHLDTETFLNKNKNAKQLELLMLRKRWDGESFCENFFSKVTLANEKIYIVCEVFNIMGRAFAVVFEYEYETDSLKYVFSKKIGTRVFHDFVLCAN